MKRIVSRIICVAATTFVVAVASVQRIVGQDNTTPDLVVLVGQFTSYYRDLNTISRELSDAESLESLKMLDKQIKRIDLKWNNLYIANEHVVGGDDALISVVVEWQTLMEQLDDSMKYKRGLALARSEFARVKIDLESKDSLYDGLAKKAVQLSMAKPLADQLEQLKGEEQVAIASVNTNYGSVKQLSEQYVELKPDMDSLDRIYIELKRRSEIVQSQVYEPLFARIKDYLIGLASVAMILMFLNMAQAKYKQIKGESKRLKELKKMMDGDKQYPTI